MQLYYIDDDCQSGIISFDAIEVLASTYARFNKIAFIDSSELYKDW